ncbi:helix-turn-helix transcriptional regulator [Alsobacter sp. SYSU M60028]|uniref:Helix-turn-helix transcriptional regulator n=1 Tax=Alsobacter ponti TaxID=2962936 RepID=A0ABT1L9R8_9HYPH|nr:AraC family transcriptional regulator [Alsobacter ponti]MCP8938237.1 helix-turn-helix transcriptional regulator [Alsobacter ponti]
MRSATASPSELIVRSILFSTDDFARADRLDAWNAAFGTLNEITLPEHPGVEPRVRCENWMLGAGMVLSETRVGWANFQRDVHRRRRDHIDHWVLRVIRRGKGRLRHPGFEVTTGPGDLVLFSASDTWSADWRDVEWVSLCFPRDFDLRLTSGLDSLPRGLQQGTGAALLADLMLLLPARAAAAPPEELPCLAAIVQSAISSCLLAGRDTHVQISAASATAFAKERVRRAILRDIASSRLTPARLAFAAGLSRSALYRLFEPEGGVARYVRNIRLSLAHAALQDPASSHKTIAMIAEEHGFPDPPEFSRAFRAQFRITPSEVRKTGQVSVPRTEHPHPPLVGGDFAAVIYRRLDR